MARQGTVNSDRKQELLEATGPSRGKKVRSQIQVSIMLPVSGAFLSFLLIVVVLLQRAIVKRTVKVRMERCPPSLHVAATPAGAKAAGARTAGAHG